MSATVESTPAGTAELAAAIAGRADDELRAIVRLLHRAFEARSRLGWAGPDEPVLVAEICLTITRELVRRGTSLHVCGPCLRTVTAAAAARRLLASSTPGG